MPPTDRQFWATCRGVSDYGYVFIEDAQWNVTMNQSDVDAILQAWDEATPEGSIDPEEGIYDIETSVYGQPPNVDGWPGVVLLYYEIGCFMGTCFDGFYRYDDELAGPHSNLMDMIHLEATQTDPASEYMLGVTAHEFNHMLQMVSDLNEDIWLSESLAEAAMIVTGYDTDLSWLADFVTNPTTTFWDDGQDVNYGAALLLGTYLYEYGGTDLLTAITADSTNGEVSVEDHLIELGLADSFSVFFGDMATAIAADSFDTAKDLGKYRYQLLEVGELNWPLEGDAGLDPLSEEITMEGGTLWVWRLDNAQNLGAVTVSFPAGEADQLEAAVVALGATQSVGRFNSTTADWPSVTIVFDPAETVLVVLADPTHMTVGTTVTLQFQESTADDDTADDDQADDDSSDDDAADDDAANDDTADDDSIGDDDSAPDDDQAGDDDDKADSGCGC